MLLLSFYGELGIIKHQIIKKFPQIAQISQIYEVCRADLVAKEMRLVQTATQRDINFTKLETLAKYWTQKRPKNNVLVIENKKAVC